MYREIFKILAIALSAFAASDDLEMHVHSAETVCAVATDAVPLQNQVISVNKNAKLA